MVLSADANMSGEVCLKEESDYIPQLLKFEGSLTSEVNRSII